MRCIGAAVLTMFWAAAYATETRNCTDDEELAADRQLLAISEDETRSGELIESHLPFGIHTGTHASQGGPTNEKLLVQAGYVTLHDGDLRTALWTAHKLTDKDVIAGESADRVECFRQDIRLQEEHAAIKKDYEEPIFDRGHLTPDADLKDDVTEQVNSYVLSNMAPQHRRFNRGIWKELEGLGREWAKTHEAVYVTTGALFDFNPRNLRDPDDKAARMGSRDQTARVGIASHFYKVFLRRCEERWCSIVFVLEHHNGPTHDEAKVRLQAAIEPLAFIEKHAETKFHPKLDRDVVNASVDGSRWGLAPE